MPWVRLEDDFFQHPKIAPRSLAAKGLWATAIGYSNYYLTDGHISRAAARLLGATKRITDELEQAGLWKVAADGWVIHDYHHYQPTAQSVRDRREERARSGRKGAQNRWGKSDPPDGNSHSSSYGNSHGKRDAPVPGPRSPSLVTSRVQSSSVNASAPDDDDRAFIDPRIVEALTEVGHRRHQAADQAGRVNGDADSHLQRCITNALTERLPAALEALASHPTATVAELADIVQLPTNGAAKRRLLPSEIARSQT